MLRHLFNALLSRCLNAPAPRPTRYYPPIRRPRPLKGHEQQAPPLRRFYPARQTLYLYRQPQLLLRQTSSSTQSTAEKRAEERQRKRSQAEKRQNDQMLEAIKKVNNDAAKMGFKIRPYDEMTIVDAYDVLEVEHLSHCSELGNKVNQILNRWAPSLAQMPLALDWRRGRRYALLGYDLRNDVDDDSSHL